MNAEFPHPYTLDDAEGLISAQRDSQSDDVWAIVDDFGTLVGIVGI